MYTLTLTAIDYPDVNFSRVVNHSVFDLRRDGWDICVKSIPSHITDGYQYGPYDRIVAKRELQYLDTNEGIRKYWATELAYHEAQRIAVRFHEAAIYRGRKPERGKASVAPTNLGDIHWNWDCVVDGEVEISVDGGQQCGEENLEKFTALCLSWDRKFRVARKLRQLIGVSVSQNQGAIDRLQGEILEQVMAL